MSEHTPGQWGSHGLLVSSPSPEEAVRRALSGDVDFVCKRICIATESKYISHDEAVANARLIAAAPIMRDLLGDVLHDLSSGLERGDVERDAEALIKVIRRFLDQLEADPCSTD